MKKKLITITILLLTLPVISFSQSFSLQELISFTTKNLDDFDTYVTNKGYKFQETTSDEDVEGVTYALNQNEYSKKAIKFITLYTKYFSENTKSVTFQTSISAEYLKIKTQAKTMGFKFIRTETHTGSTSITYTKGKFELSLWSIQDEEEDGKLSTVYEISLKKDF